MLLSGAQMLVSFSLAKLSMSSDEGYQNFAEVASFSSAAYHFLHWIRHFLITDPEIADDIDDLDYVEAKVNFQEFFTCTF